VWFVVCIVGLKGSVAASLESGVGVVCCAEWDRLVVWQHVLRVVCEMSVGEDGTVL
jgi:hypothetical protein